MAVVVAKVIQKGMEIVNSNSYHDKSGIICGTIALTMAATMKLATILMVAKWKGTVIATMMLQLLVARTKSGYTAASSQMSSLIAPNS